MKGFCTVCNSYHDISPSFSGKLMAAGLSTVIAPRLMRNPLVALVVFVGTMVVGHYVDKQIEKQCPTCGTVLQLLERA